MVIVVTCTDEKGTVRTDDYEGACRCLALAGDLVRLLGKRLRTQAKPTNAIKLTNAIVPVYNLAFLSVCVTCLLSGGAQDPLGHYYSFCSLPYGCHDSPECS